MPARKRRRFRPNWGPIVLLVLLANVAIGLAYSPLTAVTRVKVTGVPDWDRARVEDILAKARGVPSLRLDVRAFESEISNASAVKSVDFRRNLFGRAELRASYRTPVARLAKPQGVAVDESGALFSVPVLDSKLPAIVPPADGWQQQLTLLGSWPRARIARLCIDVEQVLAGESFVVELEAGGRLCLSHVDGAIIELGTTEKLDDKLAMLKKLLANDPTLLSRVKSLNIAVPDKPAMTPKDKARP